MSHYLIDTDWIVDSLHGVTSATETLLDLAPRGLAVSLISYGEIYQGAHYAQDSQAAIKGLRQFLRGKQLLSLTRALMERFGVAIFGVSRD